MAGGPVVGVETVLLTGVAGAVVTVINWGGVTADTMLKLSLTLPPSMGAPELGVALDAWSGKALSVAVTNESRVASVQIQARLANFIVFQKRLAKSLRADSPTALATSLRDSGLD